MRWLLVVAILAMPLVAMSVGCSKPAPTGPGVTDTSDPTKIRKLGPPPKTPPAEGEAAKK